MTPQLAPPAHIYFIFPSRPPLSQTRRLFVFSIASTSGFPESGRELPLLAEGKPAFPSVINRGAPGLNAESVEFFEKSSEIREKMKKWEKEKKQKYGKEGGNEKVKKEKFKKASGKRTITMFREAPLN